MIDKEPLTLSTYMELFDLVAGDLLGVGLHRRVHVFKPDPTKVIKLEAYDTQAFHNVREWDFWKHAQDWPETRKYLAPCRAISPRGDWLIMDRVKPLTEDVKFARLPGFMTDIKRANFGYLNGRIVACDYGYTTAQYRMRLGKRKFWG